MVNTEEKKNTNIVPVVFRIYRDGDVVALFPTLEHDYSGRVTCYAHVGQHGGADWNHVMTQTKPAKPEEYADLLAELRGIYESEPDAVTLKVVKRRPKD